MTILGYLLAFLAGLATLVTALPKMATDGQIPKGRLPEGFYNLSSGSLVFANVLAITPAIIIVAIFGLFSLHAVVLAAGLILGALPVLMYFMIDRNALGGSD